MTQAISKEVEIVSIKKRQTKDGKDYLIAEVLDMSNVPEDEKAKGIFVFDSQYFDSIRNLEGKRGTVLVKQTGVGRWSLVGFHVGKTKDLPKDNDSDLRAKAMELAINYTIYNPNLSDASEEKLKSSTLKYFDWILETIKG